MRLHAPVALLLPLAALFDSAGAYPKGKGRLHDLCKAIAEGTTEDAVRELASFEANGRNDASDVLPDDTDPDRAPIDRWDRFGLTPLDWATRNCNEEAAAMLIEWGASVDALSRDGSTALHFAAMTGCVPIAWSLMEKGVNLGARQPKAGMLALHWCGNADPDSALLTRLTDPCFVLCAGRPRAGT